jgi:hypothetical protein
LIFVGHSRDKKYIVLSNFETNQECNVLREVAETIATDGQLTELLTAELETFAVSASDFPILLSEIRTALRIMDKVTP